ncbi:hypothetical protein QUF90_13275 [Desulfococcaceae bacterium HSG9]|nr:hypothetical protein [Desulfococcaceae bacterium HSG9]
MFYSGIANSARVINRYSGYSSGYIDTWTTSDYMVPSDWHTRYRNGYKKTLGFAPGAEKSGTHPIYSGQINHPLPNGSRKANRFLSKVPIDYWNFLPHDGLISLNWNAPVFWLYDNPGPGRKELYQCFDDNMDTFVTDRGDCEGHGAQVGFPRQNPLGYIDSQPNTGGMEGSLQYKILMATSDDGIHWTRFAGADSGGSIITPQYQDTNYFNINSNCCKSQDGKVRTMLTDGGALWPSATVRDGHLELYFHDNSMNSWANCRKPASRWRIRIPTTDIENAGAYLNAERQKLESGYGNDIAWSPMYNRYFIYSTKSDSQHSLGHPDYKSTPMLAWSECNPDPSLPPTFPAQNRFEDFFPNQPGRVASSGAITKGVGGQALDFYPNQDPKQLKRIYGVSSVLPSP